MGIKSNNNIFISIIILSIVTIGIFHQVLLNDFVNIDDHKLILDNKVVNDKSVSIIEAFKWRIFKPHYKPLTILFWKLEYSLVGEKPFLFHFNNLMLHLANVLLIFFIGVKLLIRFLDDTNKVNIGALIVALFFATHPLHVESVAWATERKDVLFAFFFLGSWFTYLKYLENNKYWLMLLAGLLYLFSIMSKSTGITLIAVLFLTDYLYQRKLNFKLVIEKLPIIIALIASAYIIGLLGDFTKHTSGLTFVADEGIQSNYEILNEFPPLIRRLLMISFRFLLWIVHIFIPVKLSLVYPKNEMLNFFGKGLVVLPFIIGILLIFIFLIRKKYKEVFWGFIFYCITISPAISISETGLAVFLPDRYTYIPMIGFAFIVTVLAIKYIDKFPKAVYGLLGIILLFLSYQTYSQVKVWENTGTLWSNVIKHTFCYAEAYNTRANYYKETGKTELAMKDYSTAIDCDNNLPQAYYGRALILFNQKEYQKALDDFNHYIELKKNKVDEEAYVNRAAVLSLLKNYEKALEDIGKALEINPEYFTGYLNRAVILRDIGRFQESIADWGKCIELQPGNFLYYKERGNSFYKMKKFNEALTDYSKAIEIDPKNGALYVLKAYSLFMIKQIDEAEINAVKAKELGVDVGEKFWNALAKNKKR